MAHRMRVQNAKSVVNSQPPIKMKEKKPCKEMSFIELMNSVRNAIQQKSTAHTFTNLATTRRRPLGNCSRLNVGNGAGGDTGRSNTGDSTFRCADRFAKGCVGAAGPGGDCGVMPNRTCVCVNHACCNAFGIEKLRRLRGGSVAAGGVGNGCGAPEHVMKRNRFDYLPILPRPSCQMSARRVAPRDWAHTDWEWDYCGAKSCLIPDLTHRVLDPVAPRCCGNTCLRVCQSDWRETHSSDIPSTQLATSKTRTENGSKKTTSIPPQVLHRYRDLAVSNDIMLLRRLLRPRIFFDLEVKGVRPLGRLSIQLYTEACPEVVLEFVRTCTMQNRDRVSFTRLFPPLWLEGELALTDNKTLTAHSIEHDTNVLDHGTGAGILSFPSRYVRGSKRRFLSFSISFKPLNVLNGKRIAFGRVRRGHWILDAIQDYGTNSGKPQREIIVKHCGMLQ